MLRSGKQKSDGGPGTSRAPDDPSRRQSAKPTGDGLATSFGVLQLMLVLGLGAPVVLPLVGVALWPGMGDVLAAGGLTVGIVLLVAIVRSTSMERGRVGVLPEATEDLRQFAIYFLVLLLAGGGVALPLVVML